ncbi:hypothetical protein J2X60_002978 [Curtobacterium sp. 320]|uniref:hypothetical protein n=1 Tax=Curtobacterium sp. 320 TaxID=2817749 RepID=UPI00285A933D|nr:hypothetical protein [Curtobacterium sp. 320]MDR6574319.1 hypothetical protein [Curtobacterium sp. 320]
MDVGYTYAAKGALDQLSLHAPPEFEPPTSVTVTRDGAPVVFVRLSDVVLTCGKVSGVQGSCTSAECHRRVIGECQCGRHRGLLDRDPDDMRPRIEVRVHDEGST